MSSARRVGLRRSGGIVATRPLEIEVDLAAGEGDADGLAGLLAAVDIGQFASGAIAAPGSHADSFRYELTLDVDGSVQTIVCDQQALPSELRPVVERLERRAVARARERRDPS